MRRRRFVYIGIALALVVVARLVATRGADAPPPEPSAPSASTAPPEPDASGHTLRILRRPPAAVMELGVLSDRPEPELRALVDRDALASLVQPKHCGEPAACEAVRAAIRDDGATHLEVVAGSDWDLDRLDVDASARGAMTTADRARIQRAAHVVVVHVATAVTVRQLPLRTAIAAAAAIAEKVDGLVYDQLLARVERARDFAAHAVTEPVGTSVFRRDRIELLYEPTGEGVVRILTGGLARWGAPDVEIPTAPTAAVERLGEIVLGVARSIADGASGSSVTISRDDIARARGEPYPGDAGLPEATKIDVDVTSVHPEAGDPNDFIARIEPAAGEGIIGYLDLAERFFGSVLAAAPSDDVMRERRAKAQRELAGALTKWDAEHARGTRLLVQVPFEITGDAGAEWMWIEVTRHSARTITGRLTEDPIGATTAARGDEVTRPTSDVTGVDLRAEARNP